MEEVIGILALALVAVGLLQWGGFQVLGRREARRGRTRDAISGVVDVLHRHLDEEHRPVCTGDLHLYFLVPCLDEARVIARTVEGLLDAAPDAQVVVVDDASSDETAAIAGATGGGAVEIVRRELPHARQGKGAALNAGLSWIRDDVARRGLRPSRVVIGVMDADGRLSDGAVPVVLRLFLERQTGGVQLPVRIRNRDRMLTEFQDFEFWGMAASAQVGRGATGTVSLGGNGQFTRLSALDELGAEPWSAALTEDLDLAVSLLVAGWSLHTSVNAHVEQEGVPRLRPLLRQRTRWMQGHMTCTRRIPEVWRSTAMSNAAALELVSYLAIPFLFVLPWSLLFTYGLVEVARSLVRPPTFTVGGSELGGRMATIVIWYLLSFAPFVWAGLAYHRKREGQVSRGRALLLAHLLMAYNYVTFLAGWGAVIRVVRRRHDWTKTGRTVDEAALVPTAERGAAA